ncbi:MAG: hypothetical protein M0Q15_16760 [Nevskia sp.]|jgi:hypothetical protein|nr:hypothetical protein [Nevskia sp.]
MQRLIPALRGALCVLVGLMGLSVSAVAQAQAVDLTQEYSERVKMAQMIGPLGPNLFGDSTNFYDGQTTFTTTDIDLPGNNKLAVQLTRRWAATAENRGRAIFAGWDVDVPYLTGNYAQSLGWRVGGSTPYNRCSSGFGPPSAAGTYRSWSARTYWRGVTMSVPGAGSQELLINGAVPQPTDGQTSRLVTAQNWQIRCLSQLADAGAGAAAHRHTPEWRSRHLHCPAHAA